VQNFEALPGWVQTERTAQALAEDGISAPNEGQIKAFTPILEGQHVVIDSATGTGKTLAYLLPLLQKLAQTSEGKVVGLSPSAELAVQTFGIATRYKAESISLVGLVSGGNLRKQQSELQKSTRLVLGTPGRVLEAIRARKLKGVSTFVLDEPEPILSAKDGDFLREVLSRPPRPQLILVGATFGIRSAELIARFMGDAPVVIKTSERPLQTQISHARVRVRDAGDRDMTLERLLEKEKSRRALVYVNQAHLVRHIFRHLEDAGFAVVTLSPERTKDQCKQALRAFSEGAAEVLITTDSAATGIDIDSIPWVIHYELPHSTQAYVHRAGRTGRAGKTGRSIVLAMDEDRVLLKRFERDLDIEFEELRV
jgi:superfamily II DNA/RNA helicase